jgi:hypothetical protein
MKLVRCLQNHSLFLVVILLTVTECSERSKLTEKFIHFFLAEAATILEGPVVGQKASEGQTINLTCQVFGSPKPQIVWLKGQEQLTGGRFTVMEDGNLQISVSNYCVAMFDHYIV